MIIRFGIINLQQLFSTNNVSVVVSLDKTIYISIVAFETPLGFENGKIISKFCFHFLSYNQCDAFLSVKISLCYTNGYSIGRHIVNNLLITQGASSRLCSCYRILKCKLGTGKFASTLFSYIFFIRLWIICIILEG